MQCEKSPATMKCLVLSLLLLATFASCNAKKKIQHKEKLILERLVVVESNKDLIELRARVDKINKTSYAINSNFTILQDLPPITDTITVFAEANNEYRKMPITFSRSLCDMYKAEAKWVFAELTKHAHIPMGCPIKKGSYYIKDFVPNTAEMPFVSPWSKVKAVFNHYVTKTKEPFVVLELYARLDRTGEYYN